MVCGSTKTQSRVRENNLADNIHKGTVTTSTDGGTASTHTHTENPKESQNSTSEMVPKSAKTSPDTRSKLLLLISTLSLLPPPLFLRFCFFSFGLLVRPLPLLLFALRILLQSTAEKVFFVHRLVFHRAPPPLFFCDTRNEGKCGQSQMKIDEMSKNTHNRSPPTNALTTPVCTRRFSSTLRKLVPRCTRAVSSNDATTTPLLCLGRAKAQNRQVLWPALEESGLSRLTTCLPHQQPAPPDGLVLLRQRLQGTSSPSFVWLP